MGGSGGIPWTARRRYCEHYGIRGELAEMFFDVMDILSSVQIEDEPADPALIPEMGPPSDAPVVDPVTRRTIKAPSG